MNDIVNDDLTNEMPSFSFNINTESTPTTYKDFRDSRYVVCAEVTDANSYPHLVFLAHIDNKFYWTPTANLPLVCYGETLIDMKELMTLGVSGSQSQIDSLGLVNIRPYMMTSTLTECYTEYLNEVKEIEEKELFERYDSILAESFSNEDRMRIERMIKSQVIAS